MAAPILLCDTEGMARDRWLECRMHGPDGDIPYTVGGSDVSIIFAINPWNTPLELWRVKTGIDQPAKPDNEDILEMGHLMEPIVAHWYAKKSGNAIIPDTGLYQHAKYQYALANLDYRMEQPDGRRGILECKTTTWRKADAWADEAIPPYYELQVRFYMAVMDMDFADICCMWGTNPETDMAIRRINRDLDIEAEIFEKLDEFIHSLEVGVPPTMADVKPELAMKALARIYSAGLPALPTVEFGRKYEKNLRRIAALQMQNVQYKNDIKKNEEEVCALSVRIAEAMKDHTHGILETLSEKILIDYVTRTTRRPDSKKLKKEFASVYEEVLKVTSSRTLQVTIESMMKAAV